MKVKVERIRAGRRLPDIDYIETRSPRRAPRERAEVDGVRFPAAPVDEPPSKLRLPWQIRRRAE
jgi:hypothetical protein